VSRAVNLFLQMKTKKVAIVGASGYSGEELVETAAQPSARGTGRRHLALRTPARRSRRCSRNSPAIPNLRRSASSNRTPKFLAKQADVVFLALPHGVAAEFAIPLTNAGVRRHRFERRLPAARARRSTRNSTRTTIPRRSCSTKAVYGLPEVYRDEIKKVVAHRLARAAIRPAFCCRRCRC
jgi:N-acetyl-gamma-glutamyl-phosphate reductase